MRRVIDSMNNEDCFQKFLTKGANIAREVDLFIPNYKEFDLIDPKSTMGIGYKRKGRRAGFAKLCTGRKCLILRFGRSGDKRGLEKQKLIDAQLGEKYPRTETDNKKYSHETFINLKWVTDIEQIKNMIIEAYTINP